MQTQGAPFIAVTDQGWFDFLASRAIDGTVDEVSFWSPGTTKPLRHMPLGTPVFFRLGAPHHALAGYGYFAHFAVCSLDEAWRLFGWRNGAPHKFGFERTIANHRRVDPRITHMSTVQIGFTILRAAQFWTLDRWVPWRRDEGWAPSGIQRGRSETDPARADRLRGYLVEASVSPLLEEELAGSFSPLAVDERAFRLAETVVREGQGTFRARLLDAYGRACAVTGEHTEPVLAAAHIQPYLGVRSNNVQNGLLLTQEFHTLFDRGLVGITPDYEIRVSPALHERWQNGKRYYAYDKERLRALPTELALRPSREALEWHQAHVFKA